MRKSPIKRKTEGDNARQAPGVDSFAGLVGLVLLCQFVEGIAWQKADNLAEKRYFCHGLFGLCLAKQKYRFGGNQTSPFFYDLRNLFWTDVTQHLN